MPVCRSDLVEARQWCLEVTSCAKVQVKSRASTTQIHRPEVQVWHHGRTATVCSQERLKSFIHFMTYSLGCGASSDSSDILA